MAVSKADKFSGEEIYLAHVSKVLSHPARIKILKILTEMNMCICGDIVDRLPLSQSTVSQHLKELKRAGLIQGETEGPKSCYCVNHESVEKVRAAYSELFQRLNRC